MTTPPMTLGAITLEQHIAYLNQYGDALQKQFEALQQLQRNSEKRAAAYRAFSVDESVYNYCHYTGTAVADINEDNLIEVMTLQGQSFIALKQEQVSLDIDAVFDFAGDKWLIQPLFISTGNLTRQQFDMSQDVALIFSDLQDGKHEALYNLCAAYLRKLGEQYHEDLVHDNNERVQLMHTLPLNIVLCVKQYVENSINLFLKLKGE